jgi:hypothetical protein
MDITAAIVVYGMFGAKPILCSKALPRIAGPRAFAGGLATARWDCCATLSSRSWRPRFTRDQRRVSVRVATRNFAAFCMAWPGIFHESRCSAVVRGAQVSVLDEDDDHRRHHSYLLRRFAHRDRGAAGFRKDALIPSIGSDVSIRQIIAVKILSAES